jgi:Zn-dependent peptidase ImmA (M78 family)
MVSGIVQNNTHRKLSVHEFRGFALSDPIAPLIFVNGADSKAAQMFTLAHELAHLWLGQSGLSDIVPNSTNSSRVEVWCNAVAAEILAPLEAVRHDLITREPIPATVARLARNFKVSTLVILRRLLDLGVLDRAGFTLAYAQELERIADARGGTGGDFYRTTISRTGKRFLRALVQSTLEGQTLYRDAFRMLGISKTETFNEIGRSLRFQV